ncbi:MAG: response regulator [Cyclobacteriaceae bacterium]
MTSKNSDASTNVIFVVDDDAYFNRLLTAMAERISERIGLNPEIHSFQSGRECMEQLDKSPSLLLLDFYLDTRNDITSTAYDLLHDIHEQVPDAYILLISQQEDWSLFRDDLIAAGANDFLHKGKDLESRLEQIMNNVLVNQG